VGLLPKSHINSGASLNTHQPIFEIWSGFRV